MAITSGDIVLPMQIPDGRDGIRIKLRHAKLNDDLFDKTLTLLRAPQSIIFSRYLGMLFGSNNVTEKL